MGKLKRKGKAGAATNYITRNKALNKLQLTLADFRRLCILKGVYPREPKNKKKANKGSTAPATFYYTKDIQYLAHEPILKKFREHKTFLKKLTKALGKRQLSIAKNLEKNKPVYTLDFIIKERYPTFIDALRDLDDALCLIFLFSTFPSTEKITSEIVTNCQRLSLEFQHYVIHTRSLRKVFLSIKGIYYQAEIKGQQINWLVPYQFSHSVPDDVDFRVMTTFLEFYQTLVGFVNFKLFTDSNLTYPPKLDTLKYEGAAGLNALMVETTKNFVTNSENVENVKDVEDVEDVENNREEEKAQKLESEKRLETLPEKLAEIKVKEITETEDQSYNSTIDAIDVNENIIDDFTEQTSNQNTLQEQDVSSQTQTYTYRDIQLMSDALSEFEKLFSNCIFYLSREVPKYSLEFVIRSFGGLVGWDDIVEIGSPFKENDERITHQIIDRPITKELIPTRVYIQPQWVYDCINAKNLLNTKPYQPGKALPPHLSPFVEYEDGDYVPVNDVELEENEGIGENAEVSDSHQKIKSDIKNESENENDMDEGEDEDENDMDEDEEGEDENDMDEDENDVDEDDKDTSEDEKVLDEDEESEKSDTSDINNEIDEEELIHQKELEAEARGISFSEYQVQMDKNKNRKTKNHNNADSSAHNSKKRNVKEIEEKERKELGMVMMSKKQKKLYAKIQYGKNKKNEKVQNLEKKKRNIMNQKKQKT
ncbi:hypothetical protein Glove_216g199 [Diversispora epigaea]|uniref:Pescadillo homolog n=1 Tax=Diversispora epigaea TaxID=1348612 RepID=A0A397IQ99_9GLOM|nr:hypothetical protein Glove_216g199 [Diversispora epigaea]